MDDRRNLAKLGFGHKCQAIYPRRRSVMLWVDMKNFFAVKDL